MNAMAKSPMLSSVSHFAMARDSVNRVDTVEVEEEAIPESVSVDTVTAPESEIKRQYVWRNKSFPDMLLNCYLLFLRRNLVEFMLIPFSGNQQNYSMRLDLFILSL